MEILKALFCVADRSLKATPVDLCLGRDREDHKDPGTDTPVDWAPATAPGARAKLASTRALLALDGAAVRRRQLWAEHLELLASMLDRNAFTQIGHRRTLDSGVWMPDHLVWHVNRHSRTR